MNSRVKVRGGYLPTRVDGGVGSDGQIPRLVPDKVDEGIADEECQERADENDQDADVHDTSP